MKVDTRRYAKILCIIIIIDVKPPKQKNFTVNYNENNNLGLITMILNAG